MKIIFGFTFLLLGFCHGFATISTPRNLLQKQATVQQVKERLLSLNKWVPYPAYHDRNGWAQMTKGLTDNLVKQGEKQSDYKWQVVKATDYLEYEHSGSRVIMEQPYNENVNALAQLMIAELAEGKGRFMDQIINGAWALCDMQSWALSAHLTAQKSKRSLPDPSEQVIDLVSGDVGSLLSWASYFFTDEWDKINPVITKRVNQNIRERVLIPYMQRSDYWWQALQDKPGQLVNNWNPWCNANVLTCFLLLEKNTDSLAAAVHRTMRSADQFLNYVKEDGACEEGPSYWGHAAGKMYDYLQLLYDATGGKISIFDKPMIRGMGEYIVHSYVGNDWVVNFADASAKNSGEPGLIYRYGVATGSMEMQQFAAWLFQRQKDKAEVNESRDFFRTIENLHSLQKLKDVTPAMPGALYSWYPQTQFCYIKNKAGFFLAAKGGHNNESHNHNDVGTFSLYVDTIPFFIDAGVGTYTRQTFSSERYSIWTMQSNYHNLPQINGSSQQFGAQYKAGAVNFDPRLSRFSLDIGGAYNKAYATGKWVRTYTLSKDGLSIEDGFLLNELKKPNILNFMTWAKPDISQPGTVVLNKEGKLVRMHYNADIFEPGVEVIPQTDIRLSRVWGKELYRLSLTAKKMELKGNYKITISK